MSDIARLLDLLDEAVGQAAASVGQEPVASCAELARSARKRVGYLGSSVVVALAGGTGSGKSSLLNAIAGEYVAEVAAIRPTTSEPLAWLPQMPEPGVVR
ncbi:MAG: 50S ribosome-binding GTPase, partial [Acidimicrobiia bacterium]|nr:50S ribosome-binding GTPase [Acidimicrobiia bacterium]